MNIDRLLLLILLGSNLLVSSCSSSIHHLRSVYDPRDPVVANLAIDNRYIKVHLRNGYLAVLQSCQFNNEAKLISGRGFYYNNRRKKLSKSANDIKINYDDCVLVETNQYEGQNFISPALMTVSTAISFRTVPCIFNPKSCFGSCPTFYSPGASDVVQAEGFSTSITRSMEESDIDRLPDFQNWAEDVLEIEVRNEALETHYIRNVEILVFEKPEVGEIQYGSDKFYHISDMAVPIGIDNFDDQSIDLFVSNDQREYLSRCDSFDLGAKESIIFDFDSRDASSAGILITQRQSLMTTFLYYQSLAYMGTMVGEVMAAYERLNPLVRRSQKTIYDLLGGIEVSILINGNWKRIGIVEEQGPIASKTQLLPVELKGQFCKVKLLMTRGLWKIDQVVLCNLQKANIEPVAIRPMKLLSHGVENDSLLDRLLDSNEMLINSPGDSQILTFVLGRDKKYQVFLKSQGYYTEWMREEWLKEEDPEMMRLILESPREWLRVMAPKYKRIESQMERIFWSSKFGNHD